MRRWRDAKRAAEAEGRPPPPTIRYNAFSSRRIHGRRYLRVDVGRERAEIYYSTVRKGREEAESAIEDVVGRLNYLSDMMKDEKLRKALKALDEDLCKVICILCPSG
jgi:hypothetical protein